MVNHNRAISPPIAATTTSVTSAVVAVSSSNSGVSPSNLGISKQPMTSNNSSSATPSDSRTPAPTGVVVSQFAENFWGDKLTGFEVLCQNLKHSVSNVKELDAFVRECANCEDAYSKTLNKLVGQLNKSNPAGTFTPVWTPLKELNEKYASLHVQQVHQMQELAKEIQRYMEELSKRVKKIRENETQTQNVVQSFQEITQALNKSREQYHNLCQEFEKQKRGLDANQLAQFQQLCLQQQQQVSTANLMANGSQASSTGVSTNTATTATSNLNTTVSSANLSMMTANLNNTTSYTSLPPAQQGGLTSQPTSYTSLAIPAPSTSLPPLVAGPTSATNGATPTPPPSGAASTSNQSAATTTERLTSLATSITTNNKVSQLLKLEKKTKLALDEYKSNIEKYNNVRGEYERKLADSCNHFQFSEETHLKQMKAFMDTFSRLHGQLNTQRQQLFADFSVKLGEQYSVDYLINSFVDVRRTGQERPEPAQFVEYSEYVRNNNNGGASHVNSPVPMNLLNENEFNLVINGVNSSSSNRDSAVFDPFDSSRGSNNPVDLSLFNNPSLLQPGTNQTIPAPPGQQTQQQRATPTASFFTNASNLYSQLTNSSSTTTLNSINNNPNQLTAPSGPNLAVNPHGSVSPSNINTDTTVATTTSTKKSEGSSMSLGGRSIFNVDLLLGRRKKAAAAALAAATGSQTTKETKSSKFSRNKKSKQAAATSTSESPNNANNVSSNRDSSSLNSEDSNNLGTSIAGGANTSTTGHVNNSELNSSSSNHPDQNLIAFNDNLSINNGQTGGGVGGSMTARSISSMTGSLSLDLLDHLRINNPNINSTHNGGAGGPGDIDSEGFSIRPPDSSSIGLRRRHHKGSKPNQSKTNDGDMNNFYNSASCTDSGGGAGSSSDSDSDDDTGSTSGPMKVMLRIKPKQEVPPAESNTELLREISKNLQLKPLGSSSNGNLSSSFSLANGGGGSLGAPGKKSGKTYYYNYGTAAAKAANNASMTTSNTPVGNNPADLSLESDNNIPRSLSVGTLPSSSSISQSNNNTSINNSSLFDIDLNFSNITGHNSSTSTNNTLQTSLSLGKLANNNQLNASIMTNSNINNENSLYNIDEDKEVECSFQYSSGNGGNMPNYSMKKSSTTTALQQHNSTQQQLNNISQISQILNSSGSNGNNNNNGCSSPAGRFTPACFPGRTTPDFRHSASLFEQQATRASIVSPLTVSSQSATCEHTASVVPIAIAFTETVHAFFKLNEPSKFKVKCFGCMKISFPYAVLKLLSQPDSLLPQLKFKLANLHVANQDLKVNQQLVTRMDNEDSASNNSYDFDFITPNLCSELRQQHQQNKQAAFFNFELLKYEFKYGGNQQTPPPLVLNAHWSYDLTTSIVNLSLDYTFSYKKQLSQVNFMLIMPLNPTRYKISVVKPENVSTTMIIPQVQTTEDKMQILWQLASLNTNGQIQIQFRVEQAAGADGQKEPLTEQFMEQFYQPVYVKFHIDQVTLSQVKFSIASGSSYKLSLLKEKVETGKYFCSSEPQQPQAQIQQYQQSKNILMQKSVNSTQSTENGTNVESTTMSGKRENLTGSLSTSIGSSVDLLLHT